MDDAGTAPQHPLPPWPERLALRPSTVLVGVLVVFVVVHLARIGVVLANADGDNYLKYASDILAGDLSQTRYSPGFAFLLTPIALLSGADFLRAYMLASLLNLALSICALVLVHRFLARYLAPWVAVAGLAVFALGQSATIGLSGAEVEPVALLSVSAFLLLVLRDRRGPAVVATLVGAVCRVALVPFFATIWLLRFRRDARAAVAGLVAAAAGVVYLALPASGPGYLSIASAQYEADSGGGALLAQALDIVPQNLVRYVRLGVPSIVWPSALLRSPPGMALGALTFACAVFGAWRTARRGRHPELVAMFAGTAVYLAFLLLWPAHDEKVIRLVLPVAPIVLVAVVFGVRELGERLPRHLAAPLLRCLTAGVLALALVPTAALAVNRRHSQPGVSDFIAANRGARARLGAGAVLSHWETVTRVNTGRLAVGYDVRAGPTEVLAAARKVGACALVIGEVGHEEGEGTARLREWAAVAGVRVLATSGRTRVVALDAPGC